MTSYEVLNLKNGEHSKNIGLIFTNSSVGTFTLINI